MKGINLYLEGPGHEMRSVTFFSKESVMPEAMGLPFHGPDTGPLEINVLADADGNLARQADREGFRYTFGGSRIPWALMVG